MEKEEKHDTCKTIFFPMYLFSHCLSCTLLSLSLSLSHTHTCTHLHILSLHTRKWNHICTHTHSPTHKHMQPFTRRCPCNTPWPDLHAPTHPPTHTHTHTHSPCLCIYIFHPSMDFFCSPWDEPENHPKNINGISFSFSIKVRWCHKHNWNKFTQWMPWPGG